MSTEASTVDAVDTTPPVALTIAGSDSGGGAGVQADLKAFAAHRVHGTSAITALTAQNTQAVRGVFPVPAGFVAEQIEAVLADLPVAGTKTGMLATADIIRKVAELAAAGRLPNLVVDPVMVSSSGDRLLEEAAEQLYVTALIPHARVITPNIREAEVLLGQPIPDLAAQHEAARRLGTLGPAAVVVKGGHAVSGTEEVAVDVVWSGGETYELRSARVSTPNNHGTGCTFAAAIAANLARGAGVREALEEAKAYITRAVAGGSGWRLGSGHGPVDHFNWSSPQAAASSARTRSAPEAPFDA